MVLQEALCDVKCGEELVDDYRRSAAVSGYACGITIHLRCAVLACTARYWHVRSGTDIVLGTAKTRESSAVGDRLVQETRCLAQLCELQRLCAAEGVSGAC